MSAASADFASAVWSDANYLAASPDLDGVTGQFFVNSKPKTANKVTYDTDMTRLLWRVSADLVGMTPTSV